MNDSVPPPCPVSSARARAAASASVCSDGRRKADSSTASATTQNASPQYVSRRRATGPTAIG